VSWKGKGNGEMAFMVEREVDELRCFYCDATNTWPPLNW